MQSVSQETNEPNGRVNRGKKWKKKADKKVEDKINKPPKLSKTEQYLNARIKHNIASINKLDGALTNQDLALQNVVEQFNNYVQSQTEFSRSLQFKNDALEKKLDVLVEKLLDADIELTDGEAKTLGLVEAEEEVEEKEPEPQEEEETEDA